MNCSAFDTLATTVTAFCNLFINPSTPTSILIQTIKLLEANAAFQKLLDQLAIHQRNIIRIKVLIDETSALNQQIDKCLHYLLNSRQRLHETNLSDKTFLSAEKIPHTMLLDYAAKISKYSLAPDGYNPAKGLYGTTPAYFPWPPEDAMRKGVLMAPRVESNLLKKTKSSPVKNDIHVNDSDLIAQITPPLKKPETNVFMGLDLYDPKDQNESNH
ncbi:hypothetical protein MERGE_000886 [Pneumocystis wakefieldiae]|uniref:Mediator of RNA polymerase II transcription subunit 4 n=1 Tax=Pneumocystis wakefieldiae TaxID=38082 RepID=A0A899G0X5_9ASCO|nr:hypothetical protein MERGE_000886 [Pneumocystis wakefieldiae]